MLESFLHKMFSNKNINGEWFNLSHDNISLAISTIATWSDNNEYFY